MRDEEGIGVCFLKGDECLVDYAGARAWYVVPAVLCIDFFEMDSGSASFR